MIENIDPDIYYEASPDIPIELELSAENIADYIPIGSLVEYENNPNIIPRGTVVQAIDTENEQIILSNNIRIIDTPYSQLTAPAPSVNAY